jgi:CheY-like chemotaxis protein
MLDAARRPKVLVAECEDVGAYVLSAKLRHLGCDPLPTLNGNEALALFAEHQPDMVLLCMKLPPISGIEVLRQIRASSGAGRTVPIVALATCSVSGDLDHALEHGFDATLASPLGGFQSLQDLLDRLLPRPRV